jgi:hypothetical protein
MPSNDISPFNYILSLLSKIIGLRDFGWFFHAGEVNLSGSFDFYSLSLPLRQEVKKSYG